MIGQDIFSIECGHCACELVWSGSLYIGLVRFIGSLHPCNMTADWSPFSSRFNWLVFMHTNMSCQLIGLCCLSVLSDWSIFLQTSYSHPYMHCQLVSQLCHFSANLAQLPMHAIYNVSSDWSAALFLNAIWLVHFSADQNIQYMIWLVSFALFSVLTVWSALLLVLSASQGQIWDLRTFCVSVRSAVSLSISRWDSNRLVSRSTRNCVNRKLIIIYKKTKIDLILQKKFWWKSYLGFSLFKKLNKFFWDMSKFNHCWNLYIE